MADAYKSTGIEATTGTDTLIAAVAASHKYIVKWIRAANKDGTNPADVSVWWTDNSDSDRATYLGKTITVPPNTAVDILVDGALPLEPDDTLKCTASANGDIDVSVGYFDKDES